MQFVVPIVGAALISAFAAEARAVATVPECQVVLQPEDADPAWQQAVRDLRAQLSTRASGDVDCGAIEVRAGGRETSIRFTTRDGRRAERPVPAPGGLLAIVEALATTLPETPSQPDAPEESSAAPPKTVHDQPPQLGVLEPASTEATRARFLIGASGGMRVGSAASTTFGLLSFGIGVGVNVGHWEVGVLGEYDPTQVSLPGSPPGLSMSAFAVGLRAGRRDRVGPLDTAYGLSTAIVLTNETIDGASSGAGAAAGMNQQGGQASLSEISEPRVGIFAGVVVPRHAKLRLRPELGFDVIATRIGISKGPNDVAAPWWTTSATVGVEWEAP
jgi:hypothetical protein